MPTTGVLRKESGKRAKGLRRRAGKGWGVSPKQTTSNLCLKLNCSFFTQIVSSGLEKERKKPLYRLDKKKIKFYEFLGSGTEGKSLKLG